MNIYEKLLKICESKGIEVIELDIMTDGLSGLIIDNTIYINPSYSDDDKAFSLAHEMAHYYLDDIDVINSPNNAFLEGRADRMANMILDVITRQNDDNFNEFIQARINRENFKKESIGLDADIEIPYEDDIDLMEIMKIRELLKHDVTGTILLAFNMGYKRGVNRSNSL